MVSINRTYKIKNSKILIIKREKILESSSKSKEGWYAIAYVGFQSCKNCKACCNSRACHACR